MSSPMVETRNNPDPETGFPFDDRDDRDNRFSELDDIASRFPEFADHLNSFQEARRPRRTSGSSDSSWSDPFNRFSRFSSRFPRRFPDDPDFFPEHYQTQQQQQQTHPEPAHQQQQQYSQKQQPPQQQQEQQQQQPAPPPEAPKEPVPENKGDQVDGDTSQQRANLQQSNTVDLGQKQEPVDDNRNQRSMSAPPENRPNLFGRFVSSINIPNLNPEPDMGARMSSQPEQPQQKQSTERIIPIHVEGRDEPVAPKNVQPDTIFGQKPSQFTQFINREPDNEDANKQYQAQEEEYRKQQQEAFQKQHQEQQQQQQPQPEHKEPPKKATPLDLIQNIQKDVNELMSQVERFEGKPKDKQYLYLDEMLTRNLLKLDNIETEGKDTIRQARKMAIRCIEECIKVLENKAANNLKALQQAKSGEEEAQPMPEEQQTGENQNEIEAIPALPPPAEFSNMETDKTEEKPADVKETPAAEEPKSETKPVAEEPKPEVSQTEETQSFEKKKARKKADKK